MNRWSRSEGRRELRKQEQERPATAPGKRTLVEQVYGGAQSFLPAASPGKRTQPQNLSVMRSADGGAPKRGAGAALERARSSPGQPLPGGMQARLGDSFGADVSGVRVHTGAAASEAAASLSARAFAQGRDIFFRQGAYQPGTDKGNHLIAHEVAHTLQQQDSAPRTKLEVSSPGDAAEVAADRAADAFVRGERAGGLAAAPAGVVHRFGEESLDVHDYYERHFFSLYQGVRERLMDIRLPNPTPYTYWLWGRNDAFMSSTIYSLGYDLGRKNLWNVAGPSEIYAAIQRGRDGDDGGWSGTAEWVPAVAREVVGLLLPKIRESFDRLAPQFVAASQRAWQELSPERRADLSRNVEIDEGAIVPSRLIDRHVIKGLLAYQLKVNFERLALEGGGDEYAEENEQELRDVTGWQFQAHRGTWTWVRITEPADATREEAANLLLGDPGKSRSLVDAAPLFGFDPMDLTEPMRREFEQAVGASDEPTAEAPSERVSSNYARTIANGFYPPIDAEREMVRSGSDEAALSQAENFEPTGAGAGEIVSRLSTCLLHLDSVRDNAAVIGDLRVEGLGDVRDRIESRRGELQSGGTRAHRWDAHSAEELDVLGEAATGIREAAQQYRQFSTGQGSGVPDHIRDPIVRWARAFYRAAASAELPATARERLQQAREQQRLYPIEMMEGVLEYCRGELARVQSGETSSEFYGEDAGGLAEQEAQLRERLFEVRELFVTDPAAGQQRLGELIQEINEFQEYVGLIGPLGSIVELWSYLLHNADTFWSLFTDRDERFDEKREVLDAWREEYYEAYLDLKFAYSREDKEAARQKVQALRARGGELQQDFQEIVQVIEDEETQEQWLDLGARIGAMIGIAIVTMGVGLYVEGMLVTAWGTGFLATVGTWAVSSAVEAATFTAFTEVLFSENPSFSGALSHFVENWALFGALKGFALVAEGGAAAMAARTESALAQQVLRGAANTANLSANLAANIGYTLMRADQEAQASGGEGLTAEQKEAIVAESLAVFIGTMIAARYSRGFLEGMRRRGEASWMARLVSVDQMRTQTLQAARALEAGGGDLGQVRELLGRDTETLTEEIAVLREMETWARENPAAARRMRITPEQLGDLRSLDQQALQARERASIGLELEPMGGEVFSTARFDEVLTRYEELGDQVTRSIDLTTGERQAVVRTADGSTLRIVENFAWGGECFVAGTEVVTPEGRVAIEALLPGQTVLSFDPESGAPLPAPIVGSQASAVPRVLELEIGETRIRCTAMHPYWVAGRGWVAAGALSPGEALLCRGGRTAKVRSIRSLDGPFAIFNMEVAGHHSYCVSHAEVLVHNKAMRWNLVDRAKALEPRVQEVRDLAEALPEDAPQRAEIIRDVEALREEAGELSRRANREDVTTEALESSRDRIEVIEERVAEIEEAADLASLPSRARSLPHQGRTLRQEAEAIPDDVSAKWNVIEETRSIEEDGTAIKEMVDESPSAAETLRTEIERIEGRIRDVSDSIRSLRPEGSGPEPTVPRPHLRYPADHLPTEGARPYEPPSRAGATEIVRHPEGGGFLDKYGNKWEWAQAQHGGPHWDVQHPDGSYSNVYPNGEVRGDNF